MRPDTFDRIRLLLLFEMGPARMNWLLGPGEPASVIETLTAGRLPTDVGDPPPGVRRHTIDRWHEEIRGTLARAEEVVAATEALGATILSPLDEAWPLAGDPEPPGLLFLLGDVDLLTVPGPVGVVGTRRCTALGRTVAHRLGSNLAEASSPVVSGLALGIDGAAHRGCLEHGGAAIGVVGGGLDVVYPRANRPLWDEVGQRGLLLSEVPTTVRPKRWRFPARNRLIAALSDAVVVVESHERGGALSTADEALRRDIPVMAVPGSVMSSASEGTNGLLVDGAVPIRDVIDVLTYLGRPIPPALLPDTANGGEELASVTAIAGGRRTTGAGVTSVEGSPWPPESVGGRILAEVATGPVHLDRLVLLSGLTVADVLSLVQQLQAAGLVDLDGSTVVPVAPS